jgi:hypothetical protein
MGRALEGEARSSYAELETHEAVKRAMKFPLFAIDLSGL